MPDTSPNPDRAVWGWCMFCDPFGENTEAYLTKSRPTVRFGPDGGECQSCGMRAVYRVEGEVGR